MAEVNLTEIDRAVADGDASLDLFYAARVLSTVHCPLARLLDPEDYSYGRVMVTVVPWPGRLSSARVPRLSWIRRLA